MCGDIFTSHYRRSGGKKKSSYSFYFVEKKKKKSTRFKKIFHDSAEFLEPQRSQAWTSITGLFNVCSSPEKVHALYLSLALKGTSVLNCSYTHFRHHRSTLDDEQKYHLVPLFQQQDTNDWITDSPSWGCVPPPLSFCLFCKLYTMLSVIYINYINKNM